MSKFKQWLYNRFLPAWCRDDLMETNSHLVRVIADIKRENERLHAYIEGMNNAMRRQPRINIKEVKRE